MKHKWTIEERVLVAYWIVSVLGAFLLPWILLGALAFWLSGCEQEVSDACRYSPGCMEQVCDERGEDYRWTGTECHRLSGREQCERDEGVWHDPSGLEYDVFSGETRWVWRPSVCLR